MRAAPSRAHGRGSAGCAGHARGDRCITGASVLCWGGLSACDVWTRLVSVGMGGGRECRHTRRDGESTRDDGWAAGRWAACGR
eukprot:7002268-Prymnesium_polylepis.1